MVIPDGHKYSKWQILGILALAQFMVVLDISIVNVALPSISKDLNFSPVNLQWVITAYTLAFGGFLMLGGRAADLLGKRAVFVAGLVAFAATSLFAGVAQSETQLIIARGVQGLAGAFMSPAALSIVVSIFKEGQERNKALSIWGSVAAGGAAAGVLLGGVLTQYLDWRWNFFVNVPIGLLVAFAALRMVPHIEPDRENRALDLFGAVSITAGLMTLVYGLQKAPEHGWLSTHTWGFIIGSFVLIAAFIFNESRHRKPLIPLKIFKLGNVRAANLTQLPITAGMYSMFFFLTLYIQLVLGFGALEAGLGFLPVTAAVGVAAGMANGLVNKYGFKPLMIAGPSLMAVGMFILAHVPPTGGSYLVDVLPGLLIMAFGMGLSFVSVTIAATSRVGKDQAGLASGILNTSQQIGGALGLSVLSAVAASKTKNVLASGDAHDKLVQVTALVDGYHAAFFTGMGFAIAAALVAFLLVKNHKEKPSDSTVVPI